MLLRVRWTGLDESALLRGGGQRRSEWRLQIDQAPRAGVRRHDRVAPRVGPPQKARSASESTSRRHAIARPRRCLRRSRPAGRSEVAHGRQAAVGHITGEYSKPVTQAFMAKGTGKRGAKLRVEQRSVSLA